TTTYILRVQNLERPRFSRAWSNGSTAIDHNSMVRGNFLFQSNFTSGLRVFKVKRPRFPREVAFFDTRPGDDAPIFRGAWGVHAALPSGTVLVSDIQLGLFVLYFPD
ncbi:MAG: choice-of-anchor B family protein, partial [Thermoanaerobaculia bacterium]